MTMPNAQHSSTFPGVAVLLARLTLGLMFAMAGWFKVFSLGPLAHAQRLFVEPYADTFLPRWALWTMGTVIPVIELLAGVLLLVGWRRRLALALVSGVLVVVTFGHLLKDPFFDLTTHVMPRLALVLFLLMVPWDGDRWVVDRWVESRT